MHLTTKHTHEYIRKIHENGSGVRRANLKKVESASVATALAKYDFPVPGGPYNKKALHGRLLPNTINIKKD